MGRFAQRKRTGGGPSVTAEPLELIQATIISANDVEAAFSGNVTSTDFALADFNTNPSNFVPTTITQSGPASLGLTFLQDIDAEASLTYDGDVPGISTPGTVPLEL